MTKPDALAALEGKWMREELCKCRADGINPNLVAALPEALSWALDKLEPFAKGHWKPGNPDWNDYKRARTMLKDVCTPS